jgi:hypothetical protein
MRYLVEKGLSYPTDPVVVDALRELGEQATAAASRAAETGDARDIDAAVTAERARVEAVETAFADGTMKTVEPGRTVDDIPEISVPWLLAIGSIRPAEDVWSDLGRPVEPSPHADGIVPEVSPHSDVADQHADGPFTDGIGPVADDPDSPHSDVIHADVTQ